MDCELYDQSGGNYSVNKEIRIKTSMLRSDLCDFGDAYIIVKGTITSVRPGNAKRNKAATFINNAPFINCISKINGIKIDNAEDLDGVMPMYNLLEYCKMLCRDVTNSRLDDKLPLADLWLFLVEVILCKKRMQHYSFLFQGK